LTALKMGVWRSMGRDCDDDRIPDTHVLPVDMSVVLRRSACLSNFHWGNHAFLEPNVGTRSRRC
jgi:hypothetical protein